MTFQEKFDFLKDKFGKVNEKKIKNGFAIQINMTDEDCGGTFYIANMAGNFSFEPYDYRDNTASMDVLSADLESLFEGKISVADSISNGKLLVYGNDDDVIYMFDAMRKAKQEPKKKLFTKETQPAIKVDEPVRDAIDTKKTEMAKTAKKPTSKKRSKKK